MTQEYKIYQYLLAGNDYTPRVNWTRLPEDIDFKIGLSVTLYKNVVMSGGAPLYKEYYVDAAVGNDDVIVYSNPIVRIDYTFERDSISLAKSSTQTIRWYDMEGNLSLDFKVIKEYYNNSEALDEAALRRTNIINDLKVKTIGLIMITNSMSQIDAASLGKIFLGGYKMEINNYIDEANMEFKTIVQNVSSITYPWLDNMTPYGITIRQFILNVL